MKKKNIKLKSETTTIYIAKIIKHIYIYISLNLILFNKVHLIHRFSFIFSKQRKEKNTSSSYSSSFKIAINIIIK